MNNNNGAGLILAILGGFVLGRSVRNRRETKARHQELLAALKANRSVESKSE